MKHKLNNPKGETLIEVLCAILVAGLASGLLMSCFNISRNIAYQARKADAELLSCISAAEVQTLAIQALTRPVTIEYTGDKPGNGMEGTITFDINVYGGQAEDDIYKYGDNNVYSYKKQP